MADSFNFKRFTVINADAGLKVGTDGVLLGAATSLPARDDNAQSGCFRVLDIGTGTGVVALMLAQRLEALQDFHITGIEIDDKAARIAAQNFQASEWSDHLQALHRSLQDYVDDIYSAAEAEPRSCFDLIVSNPPYFENSLKAPDAQRSTARHTDTLSYRECITFAADYLSADGRLSLVLPKQEEVHLIRFASSFGLYPYRILDVKTTRQKPPKRMVVEFSRVRSVVRRESIVLQEGSVRTEEFNALTADFYL